MEIDSRIQASVTGADAGELDAWWLDARIARKLATLDALAFWRQQHGWWGALA
jgi:hypothetical protein